MLDELAADVTRAQAFPPDVRGQLISRCAAVLAAAGVDPSIDREEKLLHVAETA
jgi:hypothetical protein